MIVYRHADPRFPFFWEARDQPAARWHGDGDGPVQYCADTPDGAWAEFLRHEGISAPSELANVRRTLWAIEVRVGPAAMVQLPPETLRGGLESYPACQNEARRLRVRGATALRTVSAALVAGGAGGWKVDAGLRAASPRAGAVLVLFGARPDCRAWVAAEGRPRANLLAMVRPL